MIYYLNSNIEIHKLKDNPMKLDRIANLNSNIEIHKSRLHHLSHYF